MPKTDQINVKEKSIDNHKQIMSLIEKINRI